MKRIGEIDFLKFLFALMIVIFHSTNFAAVGEKLFPGGAIAVDFFFVTSGFLMAASSSKVELTCEQSVGTTTMQFIGRRIKGLLPNFYVAWIIVFFIECYVKETGFYASLKNGAFAIYELLFLTQSGLSEFRANLPVWYLSAMLLAMLLLYPLLIKRRTLFLSLVAPIIVIFLLGYMYQNFHETFAKPSRWEGFATRGLLRAIAEISLGCVCYSVCQKLKALRPTRLFSALLTFIELACYLFVCTCAFFRGHSAVDYIMLLALSIGITISFSQMSSIAGWFNSPIFGWMGAFSYSLFLGHDGWAHAMSKMFPDMNYTQHMLIYLPLSFATGLFIMYVSIFIQKKYPVISTIWKRLMIRPE